MESPIDNAAEFDHYRPIIESLPTGTRTSDKLILGETAKHRLYYVPFAHENLGAKLVVVGITPGPNQLELAIQAVHAWRGHPAAKVQLEAKKLASFGSPNMRPNLIRMLAHFEVARRLGIASEGDLWGRDFEMFQATSVVSHAAFWLKKGGKEEMFNGDFSEVMRSPLLYESFEKRFLPLVSRMNPSAVWIALGRTPRAALEWCADKGMLRSDQIAAFAHPSRLAGSQVDYYVRELRREDLKPRNPVLSRCDWIDESYEMTRKVLEAHLPLPRHVAS